MKNRKGNKDLKYFKVIFKYLKNEKHYIVLYAFITIISNILPIIVSILWANAIDKLTTFNQSEFILYLVLWVISWICSWCICSLIINLLYNKLEKTFIRNGQLELYDKMLNLPAIAYEDMGVGELTNRLMPDLVNIISLLGKILNFISRMITAIFIFIYSFTVSIWLGLEFLVLGIVMYILANVYYPKIKKIQENIASESDKFAKNATEDFSGIREIKALGIKNSVSKRITNIIDTLIKNQKKANNTEQIYYFVNDLCYITIEFIILLTLGMMVFTNNIGIAVFFVMQSLIFRFDNVIENISDFGVSYSKVIISLKRIDEIVNNKKYKDEKFGKKELNNKNIEIDFNNVIFKYRKEEDYVLKGLTMKLKPNQKIAIVGKSGQGKSTLFNLLMRYFDTTKGSITLNNIDIKDLSENSLRNNLSIIRQDPYLFNQSIFDNFKMVKEDITLDEIRTVCKKAYIDDYIMSLPKKYNTIIGEGGVNLSGGQKQRLAIARTLLKDTKVILFDEATSALDNESQEYIKNTIDDLVETHTIIIVAHRLSTIMDADIIYLIDDGKVLAHGTHDKLMKTSKLYKRLYNPEVVDNVLDY